MSRKYNYFDDGKSLVENGYYLLMILSIVFVAIQVIIARNSLDHNAQLELTKHTIEQDNRYRIAMEGKAEEFMAAILENPHPVSALRIDSIIMQPGNLEEMTADQLMGMMPYNDSIMANPVELERLAQIQLDLATELEQYAFFILNGFLFEEQAYNDLGNTFIRCTNLCAMPVVYMLSYRNYTLYHINEYRHIRPLYDIWWHRQQMEKCRNRIAICRSILSGDQREMEFLGLVAAAELSLEPDELRNTIRQMEDEIDSFEKVLARKIKHTSVRNM